LQFTAPAAAAAAKATTTTAAAAAKPTDKMHLQLNLNVILFKLRSARGSMLLGCCCCCCWCCCSGSLARQQQLAWWQEIAIIWHYPLGQLGGVGCNLQPASLKTENCNLQARQSADQSPS